MERIEEIAKLPVEFLTDVFATGSTSQLAAPLGAPNIFNRKSAGVREAREKHTPFPSAQQLYKELPSPFSLREVAPAPVPFSHLLRHLEISFLPGRSCSFENGTCCPSP